jgi:HTH domain
MTYPTESVLAMCGACATAKLLGQAYTPGEIAARLKVSRWTIWRAVKALMSAAYAGDCPAYVLRCPQARP